MNEKHESKGQGKPQIEPPHEIMALFVLRNLIFQKRMRMGLDA